MSDAITQAINDAADDAMSARLLVPDTINRLTANVIQERQMPLEIKGLKGNMMKVAQRIERINQKAIAFDELGAGLEAGLDDITKQVRGHGDDLEFAANVLGNSTSETK